MNTPAQQTKQIRSLLQTQFYFVLRETGISYTLNDIHGNTDVAKWLAAFEKRFTPDINRLAGKAEPATRKAGQWRREKKAEE